MRLTVAVITFLYFVLSQSISAQTRPSCLSASSDFDGDGWGWESNRSCIVDDTSTSDPVCVDTDGDGFGWDGFNTCRVAANSLANDATDNASTACVDSDGDGFGWNGTSTCLVTPESGPAAILECVDSDGDGFGWDGFATCLVPPVTESPVAESSDNPSTVVAGDCVDSDGDGFGWNGTSTCIAGLVGGVTDVILMMGQSNALGEDTVVDRNGLDAVNQNIIAWTQFDGWQVADLCTQIWQKGWFPWRGGVCSNHPAFQIAKGIVAADPSRKVAIIPTGIAGKPISWWDNGALAYELANEHTRNALAALPDHNEVDLVAWSQGEANDGVEGAWYDSLTDLISRLRGESWFDSRETVFIAQETKDSSVNEVLPRFDSDNDDLTSWIQASDLPTKDGVHWSGSALRTLGDRYAAKYLSID